MDDLDQRILQVLRRNARESFTAIAAAVDTSEATVRARMKRLVDDGTIHQFTIRTAGTNVKALVEVSVEAHAQTQGVAQTVRAWEGVDAVWEVTGDNDILVVADCPTTAVLNGIIDAIRDIPGTRATRSRLILKEH